MTSDTPEARAWRREQAQVDADIEGLAPLTKEDKSYSAYVDGLDVSDEQKIEMIKQYFIKQHQTAQGYPDAAE